MFIFNSRTGEFLDGDNRLAEGYSGTGAGRNDPDMEHVQGVGPIPRGKYKIGAVYSDPHLGPIVMHLDAEPGTDTFGRSLFRIHGDNAEHDASHGCVILPRPVRERVAASPDKELWVV